MKFRPRELCRFIYNPFPRIERFRSEIFHICNLCGSDIWVVRGVEKEVLKFKCSSCGRWFQTTKDKVEKGLGKVEGGE